MTIKCIVILLLMSFSANSVAGPWEDFKDEFKGLMENLTTFGEEAERDYTLDQLAKLHRDLFKIERSKEDLVFILKNPDIYSENFEDTLADARESTESARDRLKDLGDKVARLSESASVIEQILSETLRERKAWLSKVDLSNATTNKDLIKDGESAIKAISHSRKSLEKYLREAKN